MTQEQKAKAYDEAKCIMEKYLKSGNAGVIAENTIKNAFPELKESEDEKTRKSLISYLHGLGEFEYPNKKTYNNWLVWLEKQGEQILANSAKTCKNEQKPTWSEEDEKNTACYNPYKAVVESIAEMCKHYDKTSHSGLRDFYDNVKVKCKDAKEYDSLFSQSTWKPSEEQMDALQYIYRNLNPPLSDKLGWSSIRTLELLYNDLKKLREKQ